MESKGTSARLILRFDAELKDPKGMKKFLNFLDKKIPDRKKEAEGNESEQQRSDSAQCLLSCKRFLHHKLPAQPDSQEKTRLAGAQARAIFAPWHKVMRQLAFFIQADSTAFFVEKF